MLICGERRGSGAWIRSHWAGLSNPAMQISATFRYRALAGFNCRFVSRCSRCYSTDSYELSYFITCGLHVCITSFYFSPATNLTPHFSNWLPYNAPRKILNQYVEFRYKLSILSLNKGVHGRDVITQFWIGHNKGRQCPYDVLRTPNVLLPLWSDIRRWQNAPVCTEF